MMTDININSNSRPTTPIIHLTEDSRCGSSSSLSSLNNDPNPPPLNGASTTNLKTSSSSSSSSHGSRRTKKSKTKKPCLTTQSTALEICTGFFQAMDLDRNGFIEESEMKIIAMLAFEETEEQAVQRWKRMLRDMDTNGDQMISHEEYVTWWMEHTKDKLVNSVNSNGNDDDGGSNNRFVHAYATYLLKSLLRITSVKTAQNICDAFFDAMDANGDGFLVEDEIKNIGKWAFGAKPAQAEQLWLKMKDEMDTNRDGKISREEYSTFWMAQCRGKILKESGKFVPEFQKYLLHKLGKLRAGKKRQEQLKIWENDYNNNNSSSPQNNKRKLESTEEDDGTSPESPTKKVKRIIFSVPPKSDDEQEKEDAIENATVTPVSATATATATANQNTTTATTATTTIRHPRQVTI